MDGGRSGPGRQTGTDGKIVTFLFAMIQVCPLLT
jgi:hypothetical protein